MRPADPCAELEALLDREEDALRRAAFDELADLAARKETLMSALDTIGEARLNSLRDKAARNAGSLGAVLAGLRAARQRIFELARASEGLSTYDRGGRKAAPPPRSGVERRA